MHHFCTYFDCNYLYRGLALFYLMCEHTVDFTLKATEEIIHREISLKEPLTG